MPDGTQPVRTLFRRKLLPEKIAAYRQHHDAIWPELEKVYREHGIVSVSCFLDGNDLCVMLEVDRALFDRLSPELAKHPLELEWQSLMSAFNDPDSPTRAYEEVYRLKPEAPTQLHKSTKPNTGT